MGEEQLFKAGQIVRIRKEQEQNFRRGIQQRRHPFGRVVRDQKSGSNQVQVLRDLTSDWRGRCGSPWAASIWQPIDSAYELLEWLDKFWLQDTAITKKLVLDEGVAREWRFLFAGRSLAWFAIQ